MKNTKKNVYSSKKHNKTTKKKNSVGGAWNPFRKTEKKQLNPEFTKILDTFIHIYYMKMNKMPSSWGETEMNLVENYIQSFEGKTVHSSFHEPKFYKVMNEYLQSKPKRYWCDKIKDIGYNQDGKRDDTIKLKCSMGWDDKDYHNFLRFVTRKKYIPKEVFHNLDSGEKGTLCSELGATYYKAYERCARDGTFFPDNPPKYFSNKNYNKLQPVRI